MRNRSLPAAGAALILTLAGFGLAGPASAAPATAGDPPYGATCNQNVNFPDGTGDCALAGNGGKVSKKVAGSVGNADNKNPKGQLPNAAGDGNNGYECDGNNGIAQGNPAHSGCGTEIPS